MKRIYNPFYSLFNYLLILLRRRLRFETANIGELHRPIDETGYAVFKEIYLKNQTTPRQEGQAIFQVIFNVPKAKTKKIIKNTAFTIPFFIGLPGFCNKKFMFNADKNSFAGHYEWETVDLAMKYASSFALKIMSRRSTESPLKYRIIDKSSGDVVAKGGY